MAYETIEYSYRVNMKKMLLVLPLLGALAAFMAHLGMTNDRGLILFHAIHLGIDGARVFYWVMAVLLGGGTIAGFIRLLTSAQSRDTNILRIADDGLTLPVGFFEQRLVTIPFADIRNLKLVEVQGQRYLTVTHVQGKTNIQQQMLPDRAAFDRVTMEMAARYTPPPAVY
ncbi:MAG TPA: hypothetical protein VEF76_14045 [Patescibacteria group bacterium]|nr:hypothetical protein [Patescibacteria group bacterium]